MGKDLVIIACDSRGRNLQSFISRKYRCFSDQFILRIVILPGATIQRIITEIESVLKRFSPSGESQVVHIIISAGICNFTEKLIHLGGTELAYNRSDSKLSFISTSIQNIYDHFSSIVSCHVKTQLTAVAPVSIKHFQQFQMDRNRLFYSFFTDTDIDTMQRQLEEDIKEINHIICEKNSMQSLSTLRFDRDLLRTSIKKRKNSSKSVVKYNFNKFYDGVHPKDCLQEKWFTLICDNLLSKEAIAPNQSSASATTT